MLCFSLIYIEITSLLQSRAHIMHHNSIMAERYSWILRINAVGLLLLVRCMRQHRNELKCSGSEILIKIIVCQGQRNATHE